MTRSDFFKVFGFAIIAPSILIPNENGVKVELPTEKFNPKRWPIYPDRIDFSYIDGKKTCRVLSTYVKIERDGVEWLIPVRDITFDDMEMAKERFEYHADLTQEKYIINENLTGAFGQSCQIKYDPSIHK